ncbi:hypothetical protein GRI38_13335 [Altererythrobacter aurantiacus]|uniref:Uncharacterized protein n=1 Tax=Parapontixanthobacter aurantiacus TaxID=1463599 RepID=A0A844ZEQ9_9SPHN|nr:hypothetical protein [Parapontixanthobacter aurantiacus]MXO87011.1 hypothetical protein [Parapontixanthobacter aurantiacus]
MTRRPFLRLAAPLTLLALAACSPATEEALGDAEAGEEMIPVEPDGGTGAGAPPLPTDTQAEAEEFAQTMPNAIRGTWREDNLGRAPTAEDCNQTSTTNRNFGKVLTIREDGYSLFETGGDIIEVHNRTDEMIDATFNTSYGDRPSRARKDFALQPGGTLAVNNDDGDGRLSVTQYRRCRGEG